MTAREHAEVEAREAVDELLLAYAGDAGAINALDSLHEYIVSCIALLRAEESVRQARQVVAQWREP